MLAYTATTPRITQAIVDKGKWSKCMKHCCM
nr:MAG TPA: hypothetical protein [Caudoviricetes sp.]